MEDVGGIVELEVVVPVTAVDLSGFCDFEVTGVKIEVVTHGFVQLVEVLREWFFSQKRSELLQQRVVCFSHELSLSRVLLRGPGS